MRNIFISILFLVSFFFGCSRDHGPDQSSIILPGANRNYHNLIILPYDSLPSSQGSFAGADSFVPPLDADSIELFQYRGGEYYHPVYLGHRIQTFLLAYRQIKDSLYLRRAEKNLIKLISLARLYGESVYLPYMFAYSVHGDSGLTFDPPWYSGMAQGVVLEAAIRLYEITGKSEYLEFSERLCSSFLHLKEGDNNPWVVRLDSLGYYWIEEYPHNLKPGQTLNGYIAGVMGIYEYYRITADYRAKVAYDAALTTLKHYLPEYRREDSTSYYCLGHKMPASSAYHNLHIEMMRDLYLISGDIYFWLIAELFESDVKGLSAQGAFYGDSCAMIQDINFFPAEQSR
jgi:hypothetical protein